MIVSLKKGAKFQRGRAVSGHDVGVGDQGLEAPIYWSRDLPSPDVSRRATEQFKLDGRSMDKSSNKKGSRGPMLTGIEPARRRASSHTPTS
jgi:hypothetical protein